MLLQSLVNYYEILASKGKVDKTGWFKLNVSYGLNIDENGNLVSVISLKHKDESKKKETAQNMSVPEHSKRSSGVSPNYLCDTSTYLMGCDEKGKPQRSVQCFKACAELHKSIFGDMKSQAISAVLSFFEQWNPENTVTVLSDVGCTKDIITDILKKGANLIFMPLGKFATDYNELCMLWDEHSQKDNKEEELCLVTGNYLPIARTHPAIKGVYNAQAMGVSLVSFNGDAFESYGKQQGFNSPVSEYAAFAYSTALNYLLSKNEYVTHFGDTTVVCWTEDDNEGCQDIYARIFGGNDNTIEQNELAGVVKKLASGNKVDWNGIAVNPDNQFYILGLSPNAARLSVRFFLQNKFGNFMKNVREHEERMNIIAPSFEKFIHIPVWKALSETVNKNSKNKSVKPKLARDYLYSILTNTVYPETIFNNIMLRINAEHNINYTKASLIKAHLTKNYKEDIKVTLDKENNDCAYILGRLFSLLEEIQSKANPDINSTIRDKYFTSASSSPATIFPILVDLSQKHLKKIKNNNMGAYISFDKRLTELMIKLDEGFPSRLSLQEKGVFQIGYYHQTQKRFIPKEDK